MTKPELSPLERTIAREIDKTKGKASQQGYLKKLVVKLHLKIEGALARGCEYDDIAKAIAEGGIKISPSTLKQYHTEYRRSLEKEAVNISKDTEKVLPSKTPVPLKQKEANRDKNGQSLSGKRNLKQTAIDKLFANK